MGRLFRSVQILTILLYTRIRYLHENTRPTRKEKERSRKETDDLLAAARRLLSVTCDCCEQLTDRLEMVEPSQNTLAMLQIKNPEEDARNAMSLPFLQFICTEDQDRFSQFIAASDSQAPSSLHLRMQTCKGAPFEASNLTKVNQKYLVVLYFCRICT